MRRACLVVALALTALFAARPAAAFCRSTTCSTDCETDENGCKTSGIALSWTTGCVGVSMQHNGTDQLSYAAVSQVINSSLRTWSTVVCTDGLAATFAYARFPDVSCTLAEYDPDGTNANSVLFRDNKWPYQGTANTLAFTTVTFDTTTGEILGGDIEVNSALNHLTISDTNVEFDLASILTHEMGHMAGLAHSPDPDATMNATYDQGEISLRDLAPDDIAAMCFVYPTDRGAPCDPEPSGGFSPDCSVPTSDSSSSKGCDVAPGVEGASFAFVASLWTALAIGLRRRRRSR